MDVPTEWLKISIQQLVTTDDFKVGSVETEAS